MTNPSGNGIVLGSVRDGVIERSVAYENGSNNTSSTGPVGIWAYDADRIVIQHNESYRNRRGTGGDGDGFDFDRNTSNSVMQYNYAHENDGAGFLFWTGEDNTAHTGNVIRYNVSENDGRTHGYGGIVLGGKIYDVDVYNNTVFFTPIAGVNTTSAAIQVISLGNDVSIRNNVFVTTGGAQLVRIQSGDNGLRFQRNAYWSSGDAFAVRWSGTLYSSLTSWLDARTAQERVDLDNNGTLDIAALNLDPRLTSPGSGGTIGDADDLEAMTAYRLLADSPLRDAGLDLFARFGIDPGDFDLSGTAIKQGTEFDIGADEI